MTPQGNQDPLEVLADAAHAAARLTKESNAAKSARDAMIVQLLQEPLDGDDLEVRLERIRRAADMSWSSLYSLCKQHSREAPGSIPTPAMHQVENMKNEVYERNKTLHMAKGREVAEREL